MSVILMGAVKQRGPKEGPLRHTLLVLCDEADDFGFACPSIDSISRGSCCSVRQAMRRIQSLEEQGWVKVKRKIFRGDMANAYFVNTDKLGIAREKQVRRSPLWTNVERLLRALESRDKVSLLNGVLKFEKTPESRDIPDSGDLFGDDSASDTMSLVNEPEDALQDATVRVSGHLAAKVVDKRSKTAVEDDFAGDMVSRDKCHPRHVTSDIEGEPFNVLTRSLPVTAKDPPLPPLQGGNEPALADFTSWSLLKVRIKSELCSVPASVMRRFGEVRPGENDYDTCFRDWWLLQRRDESDRVVLVTGASDEAATHEGLQKYATRLARLVPSAFSGIHGRRIVFELHSGSEYLSTQGEGG